jgi:hypothetical protein
MRSHEFNLHLVVEPETRPLGHADHIAFVVGSIFSLAGKTQRGRALKRAEVPVHELMAEVYALVEPFAAADGVSFVVDCEHAPAVIRGERTALVWALMNLACSAVRCSPVGGRVALSSLVGSNAVELRVEGTGSDGARAEGDEPITSLMAALAPGEVETARELTELMGGVLLVSRRGGERSLFAMRFHAASYPAHRVAPIPTPQAA